MGTNDQLVDNDHITNSTADIRISNGFSFGPATRLVAGVMVVLGAFALLSGGAGFFLGPIILLAALFALTSKFGTEISLSNNYIKEYSVAFGIRSGKWQSTLMLPDLCVIKLGKTRGVANTYTGGIGTEVDASKNEVYLLSANHRKKVLMKVCNSKKEAENFARDLAQKMGKNYVPFNPKISEQTKARR
ncbi:MAG: hypothetical protein HYZ14_01025 [Bacteroidetes bacterium]|nr:hypothetical protein [Bacteroidota bacterium]